MKKKIIIGILVAALVVGGTAGGGVYYRQSHQKTVSVVSVDSLAGDYSVDDTTLEGNIVASAVQNISVDKDMIIEKVYVSKGDSVKKDDKLISLDMTLVEMELNIAKLKQQQQEQNLNKAISRLTSLKNGGPVDDGSSDDSSVTPDDTSDTGKDSLTDYDEEASAASSMNGTYLAAVINPVLAAATGDFLSDGGEETQNTAGTEDTAENSTEDNTSQDQNTSGDTSGGIESSGNEINIDISSGDDNGNNSTDDPSEDPDPSETPDPGFNSGQDVSDNIENTDPGTDPGIKDITDGDPVFHQVLDGNTEPYCGKGTKKNPYVFLVSSAKGYAVAKGSFLNKMAGYKPDGTKEDGVDGYWYLLEFHERDTVADVTNRKSSCTGYYLVDGSLLDKMVKDDSEVEFTLDGASHYDNDQDDDPGDDGGDDSGDGGESSLTREEAIKIQQTKVDSLKLDIRESKINIEKLEKKVKKQTIYSKLDGTVAKVGDAATGSSSGSYFMTVKSKEGFYVKGTVSELMLDEVKEGTKLQCSGSNGDFEADVIDVSEYPVSGDYTGSGNPNVSYYTYLATIPDKSVKVSEDDWLTVTLQGTSQQNGIVLDKAFVRSENGVSYVYKDDNGILKKQILKVGGNVNGGYSVLVTGGITRDDRIAFPYGDTVKEGAVTEEVSVSDFYGY